jgi:ankyrin repeat protein
MTPPQSAGVRGSIQGLATETLLHILEYLELREDIHAFVRTCQRFFLIGSPCLYRHNKYGQTALHLAARHGDLQVTKLLLKGEVNLNAEDNFHRTPLSVAAIYGQEAIVLLLLPVIQPSALLHAAVNGHGAIVERLLATNHIGPDYKGSDGRTPLSLAAANGHKAVVRFLLAKAGVEPDSRDHISRTPLSWASWNGHKEVVEILVATDGVSLDSEDNDRRTPLSLAAGEGHETVVQLLINTGANLDSMDKHGRTPLLFAAENGSMAVIRLLLDNGAAWDSKDSKYGQTPLLFAAKHGCNMVVRYLLLTDGIDPESRDSNGRTPLSLAAESWHEEVVWILLRTNGVDPASEDINGQTPLSWAEAMERDRWPKRNPVAKLLKDAIAKREASRKSSIRTWTLFSLLLLLSIFLIKSNY